jgi:hypothetical protein
LLEVGVGLDDDQHAEQAGRHVFAAGALGEVAEQGNLGHAQLVADKLGQHAVVGGGFLSGGGGGGHGVAWSVRGRYANALNSQADYGRAKYPESNNGVSSKTVPAGFQGMAAPEGGPGAPYRQRRLFGLRSNPRSSGLHLSA